MGLCWEPTDEEEQGDLSKVSSAQLPDNTGAESTDFGPPVTVGLNVLEHQASGPMGHLLFAYHLLSQFQLSVGRCSTQGDTQTILSGKITEAHFQRNAKAGTRK